MRPTLSWQLAVVTAALALAPAARADVPGPRSECDTSGMHCEECWRSYRDAPEGDSAFAACKEEKQKKGLHQGCSQRQGAGDAVFFCRAGENPQIVTRGCAGCALGPSTKPTSAVAAIMLLGLVTFARRSRKRRA